MNAAEFNALYEVGIPVLAYPGCRPEDGPDTRLVTRTRTKAQTSASGDPVVWVDGEGSYIALTHVDVVPEDEWKAAREAEQAVTRLGREDAKVRPTTSDNRPVFTVCPVNPPGHDWRNDLTCQWCSETRTAGEAIVSGLASRRGGDEESALRLLAAYRADVLAGVAS